VGTDPVRSPGRWGGVAGLGSGGALVLAEDAFPGTASALGQRLAAAWKAGPVVPAIAQTAGGSPALIVLVSAEAPAALGDRLRELSRSAAMKGRLLAVWPLGGPVRADLPASLLAEGNLAGLGVAEYSPLGAARVEADLSALSSALASPDRGRKRPEDLPGRLLWYF